MAVSGMNVIDWIAVVLLIIGGINWGLAVFKVNLVEAIFKKKMMQKIIYGTVGIAAVYSIWSLFL